MRNDKKMQTLDGVGREKGEMIHRTAYPVTLFQSSDRYFTKVDFID